MGDQYTNKKLLDEEGFAFIRAKNWGAGNGSLTSLVLPVLHSIKNREWFFYKQKRHKCHLRGGCNCSEQGS